MLCPEQISNTHIAYSKIIRDEDNIMLGEISYESESLSFKKCLKEECAAWDKETNSCVKQYIR